MLTIECHDSGPVEHVSIPLPEGGGVTVLLGENDTGKSTTLEAVDRLLGDKTAKAARRHDQPGGRLEGLGVTLKLTTSARRSGVLVAASIDSKLSVDDLVDPGIKDPAAADARRLKALLTISGAAADERLFHGLLSGEGEFRDVVGAVTATDLVDMAGQIKRSLEGASRTQGGLGSAARQRADAVRELFAGVDLEGETDAGKLDAAYRAAVLDEETLKSKALAHAEQTDKATKATKAMSEATETYDGPLASIAREDVTKSDDAYTACGRRVEDLEASLRAAKEDLRRFHVNRSNTSAVLAMAEQHDSLLAGWQDTIDDLSNRLPVTDDQLATYEKAVAVALEAQQAGAKIREARQELAKAEADAKMAKSYDAYAESYRTAAQGTDDVLSRAVDSDVITVKNGRLMTQAPGRGEVPYGSRSNGIRCKIAITEAASLIRRLNAEGRAVITLGQSNWEGLSPKNRIAVAAHARSLGVNIVTAKATDGEIRAEVFDEDE